MSWYIMNKEVPECDTPCRQCKKPMKDGDKYMMFGHKPPFEFGHAGCEWKRIEEEQAKAEGK